MKKYLASSVATAALVGMTAPASADAYLKVFGGANMMDDQSANLFDNDGTTATSGILYNYFGGASVWASGPYTFDSASQVWYGFSGVKDYHSELNADIAVDSGYVVGAALGCDFGNGFLGEIEFALRKNDVKGDISFMSSYTISGSAGVYYDFHYSVFASSGWPSSTPIFATGPGQGTYVGPFSFYTYGGASSSTSISGEMRAFSIMANVWYDIDLGNEENFTPYIGGGIGWADVELDLGSYTASDSGFALQVGGGVRFNVAEGVELDIGYRYFTAPDLDFITRLGYDMGVDYESHEVTVGLKFAL